MSQWYTVIMRLICVSVDAVGSNGFNFRSLRTDNRKFEQINENLTQEQCKRLEELLRREESLFSKDTENIDETIKVSFAGNKRPLLTWTRNILWIILYGCAALAIIFIIFAIERQYHNSVYDSDQYPVHIEKIPGKIETLPPNFLFILTDDQDVTLTGVDYMPNVHRLIRDAGMTMENAFVASPLCCPSRSSILTGQYVHNHGAINNSLLGHCSSSDWQNGPEKNTFAVEMQQRNYATFFAGKYLNQYGHPSVGGLSHIPPGWDTWVGLKGNSVYYNYSLSINGSLEPHGDDPPLDYLTNVVRRRALEFLSSFPRSQPFFMMLSPPACHSPYTAELKYTHNFSLLQAPRTPNFNIANGVDKNWLLRQGEQPLSATLIETIDEIFRNRLRTLLTVDDMVAEILEYLQNENLLENTYVIFTSDNGYHLGQFSLPWDKREPYETDVRVPFFIRGPKVPEGSHSNYPTNNVDLASTFLDLAGIPVPQYMDGVSLKPVICKLNPRQNLVKDDSHNSNIKFFAISMKNKLMEPVNQVDAISTVNKDVPIINEVHQGGHYSAVIQSDIRPILIEHFGEGTNKDHHIGCESVVGNGMFGCYPAADCKCQDSSNNTYACVRVVNYTTSFDFATSGEFAGNESYVNRDEELNNLEIIKNGNYIYCQWDDGEKFEEVYDLTTDPFQMKNIVRFVHAKELNIMKRWLKKLRNCTGQKCFHFHINHAE